MGRIFDIARLLPKRPLPWWQSLGLAIACVGAATAIRLSLAPFVHEVPFVTYFPAVAAAAIFGGWLGGLSALVGAMVLATLLFMGDPGLTTPDLLRIINFLISGGTIVVVSVSLTEAARASAVAQVQSARTEEQLRVLVGELGHRAKNGLSIILAIIEQSARGAQSVEEYRVKIASRIEAMSRSQTLVTTSTSRSVDLRELLVSALEPFDDGRAHLQKESPRVAVNADMALGLALIVHELATNATKYGALSGKEGVVNVGWAFAKDRCELTWRESGGPAPAPGVDGFGARLFAFGLRGQGGEAIHSLPPEGAHCLIRFPATAG